MVQNDWMLLGRRTALFVTIGAIALVMTVGYSAPASASTRARHPGHVQVVPGVGTLTVSWRSVAGKPTYSVVSKPPGYGCSSPGDHCKIEVRTSTPLQFSVTATRGAATSQPSGWTAAVPTRLLLILAGQSNATGAESFANPGDGIDYLAAPFTTAADSQDLITWEPWLLKRQPHIGLVPLDSPQIEDAPGVSSHPQVFGPEIGLARQVMADTGRPVTIVKAAYPGTTLADDWNTDDRTSLFFSMVRLVDNTMQSDARLGQLDVVGGFYWYQGESDVLDGDGPEYQSNLTNLVAAIRSELPISSTAPIALAEESLASFISALQGADMCTAAECAADLAGDTDVRAADGWAAANLPSVVAVDTIDLPRYAPGVDVHLTDVGELDLGDMLAHATEGQFP